MARAKRSRRAAAAQASAPAPRRMCGAMQVHHWLLEKDPGFRARQVELEHECARRLRSAVAVPAKPYEVRVVVHVVWNRKEENISASQVRSQLQVLNKDFRATNPDHTQTPAPWQGLVGDTMVRFRLAKRDPSGKTTNGITRTHTSVTAFGDDDSVKSSAAGGIDPWPTHRYLNIWVCTLADGLLGYAQFPGGPADTDGVVILNTAFGTKGSAKPPFDLGRTTTHEVGHYLNLRHIWGDTEDCSGGDLVADTPNAETPNFGKPAFPHISCGNGPNGDMFVNYMDYVDDDAMFMFTLGQVSRMHATLDGPRKKLVA